MTRIEVVPQELRVFCSRLHDLRADIQQHRLELQRETADIAAFWSDKHYEKFRSEQEEFWILIQIFEKRCDLICEYLSDKATRGEAYLNL